MILYKKVFYALGILFFILSGLMIIPAVVDFSLKNDTCTEFIVCCIFCCFLGGVLFFSGKSDEYPEANTKEKILIILFSWITLPILSALPFFLSSLQMSFVDSIFEATSAITTTGASVFYDTQNLSEGFLLWRSLLQLFGGIFFMASFVYIFPNFKSIYLIEDSRSCDFLYQIKTIIFVYLSLSFISSFLFVGSGIPAITSICYSFSSISTGGAIPDNSYDLSGIPHLINWMLSLLMLVGGLPVAFICELHSKGTSAFKNKQVLCYLSIVFALVILLFMSSMSFHSLVHLDAFNSLEKSFFVVISSITTTGITLNSSETFGTFVDTVLYVINFIGGCLGSCSGGIKVLRLMIVFLLLKSYLIRIIKTNVVYVPTYSGKRLEEIDTTGLFSYFLCYATLVIIFSLILSFFEMDFGKSFGAVLTCMNNNGPFFDLHRATSSEIVKLTSETKTILSLSMIAGRIDFIPLFLIMAKAFWKK